MKTIIATILLAGITACGAGTTEPGSNTLKTGALVTKTIVGEDATAFMDALVASGVKDNGNIIGTFNLKAGKIACTAPVVMDPIPECRISAGSRPLIAPVDAAKTLYRILINNGAAVSTGTVGSSLAIAKEVFCSRPVLPNPSTTCSFKVRKPRD
jgi:hypothetical protein